MKSWNLKNFCTIFLGALLVLSAMYQEAEAFWNLSKDKKGPRAILVFVDMSGSTNTARRTIYKNAFEKIYQNLQQTARRIEEGERDFKQLEKHAIEKLDAAGFETDYFVICNSETLLPATTADRELVILVTAAINGTRLLDNIEISLW